MADSEVKKSRAVAALRKCATKGSRSDLSGKKRFAEHVGRIEVAKSAAISAAAAVSGSDPDEASVRALWQLVFEYLCASPEMEVADFNTLAGVMQKLAAARVQIAASKEKGKGAARRISESGSPGETIEEIERRLNLL